MVIGPPPKPGHGRGDELFCSESYALDEAKPKRPYVPKWKRHTVQNTKGSIRRETSSNGVLAVPDLMPWEAQTVPAFSKLSRSPRRLEHRIRCPVGVGGTAPAVDRPLTMPYSYASPAAPAALKPPRCPWALDPEGGKMSTESQRRDADRGKGASAPPALPSCPGASPRNDRASPRPCPWAVDDGRDKPQQGKVYADTQRSKGHRGKVAPARPSLPGFAGAPPRDERRECPWALDEQPDKPQQG